MEDAGAEDGLGFWIFFQLLGLGFGGEGMIGIESEERIRRNKTRG